MYENEVAHLIRNQRLGSVPQMIDDSQKLWEETHGKKIAEAHFWEKWEGVSAICNPIAERTVAAA